MANATAKIVFTPSGRRGEFEIGTPVLQAARSLGVDIDSVCGGRAICGRCQIECEVGEFPKHAIFSKAEHLSELKESEQTYGQRKNKSLAADRRLSCQAKILGDLVIDVPAESQVHRQVVRKAEIDRTFTLSPSIHLYYVRVDQASMHEPKGDLQRLQTALSREWQLENLQVDLQVLTTLQETLREGEWCVTVAVFQGHTIRAIWPAFKAHTYGVAVDIGSTTIAAHLVNLSSGERIASDGIMNPQIRFGEDLMSRVSYVMMNPEGAPKMTQVVRDGINQLVRNLCSQADEINPDDILDMTIVGNPVMHHLLLGINPIELGGAPFALATDSAINIAAREIGLHLNPGAMTYCLPCIAGHVGADSAAVVLSEAPHEREEVSLLVDLGTNAEIVLGNQDRLIACSSPTGPAFEGAQISCGQRAAPGAIERVRIDRETLEPRFQIIGSELWSNSEDFDQVSQKLGVTGICGSGIIEVVAEMFLAGILNEDGVIDGLLSARNPRIVADDRTFSYILYEQERPIVVTQNDVRQIQLAKAALHAGVSLLQDHFDSNQIDRIRLAGAFGSHIDVKHAMILGLIPDCDLQQVASAGNAAGTGALIALLNVQARDEIEKVVQRIEKIETAIEPQFQEYFVNAMAIPHKTDAYPKLFSAVTKPPQKQREVPGGAVRKRRRRRKKLKQD